MNQPLRNLKKEALLLKMSPTEKAALHANLMQVVNSSAKEGDAAAPRALPSPFYFFSPQFAMPFAALMLLVVGGGTALAAKGALPGDPLYTIKTSVNEPIMGALAFSTEDKIKFHTEMAQTRLQEAEVLASQNRLDNSAVATLEVSIDTHLMKRDELAFALDEKEPGASAHAVRELNSSIAAHGEVLAVLGLESSSTTTQENSNILASKVRFANNSRSGGVATLAYGKAAVSAAQESQAPAPTMALMAVEQPTTSEAQDTATSPANMADSQVSKQEHKSAKNSKQSREEKDALSLGKRATSSLEALKRSVESTRGEVDQEVEKKLERRLARVATLVAQGEADLKAKDFWGAIEHFNEALERAATLSTFIAANQRFDNGILRNLLGNDWDESEQRE